MYRLAAAVTLAVVLLTVAGYSQLRAEEPESKSLEQVVAGNNEFALQLYSNLSSKPGNLFFSPYSISSALAMAYAGARGDTQAEMAKVLHFSVKDAELNATFGQLIKQLNGPANEDRHYQLTVANAMWTQVGHPFLADYKNLVQTSYGAGLRDVNFKTDTDAARQAINAWVEQQTKDKIKDLLKPGVLTTDTRMVLTNAIYFKSAWQEPFTKRATKNGRFTLAEGRKIDVPLMHVTKHFNYLRGDGFQAVELPYDGHNLSMTILLPDKAEGLADLEKKLNPRLFDGSEAKFEWEKVIVTMPKFKVTAEVGLKPALSSLGMPGAFTDSADFSGIDGQRDLYLQDVIHKAYVDVNEEGTEAAAATAVLFGATAARIEEKPPVEFRADHPFIFLIRESRTNSLLFIGRLTSPNGD